MSGKKNRTANRKITIHLTEPEYRQIKEIARQAQLPATVYVKRRLQGTNVILRKRVAVPFKYDREIEEKLDDMIRRVISTENDIDTGNIVGGKIGIFQNLFRDIRDLLDDAVEKAGDPNSYDPLLHEKKQKSPGNERLSDLRGEE